jgi:flagellar biosynthesis protein FliQ
MAVEELTRVISEALALVLLVSAPVLAAAILIGLLIGALSASTQVQDSSLSYVPKVLGVSLVLMVAGSWMAAQVLTFTDGLWRSLPELVP